MERDRRQVPSIRALDDPEISGDASQEAPVADRLELDGAIELEYAANKRVTLAYEAVALAASSEKIDIADDRLRGNWGDAVYRLLLTAKKPLSQGKHAIKVIKGKSE